MVFCLFFARRPFRPWTVVSSESWTSLSRFGGKALRSTVTTAAYTLAHTRRQWLDVFTYQVCYTILYYTIIYYAILTEGRWLTHSAVYKTKGAKPDANPGPEQIRLDRPLFSVGLFLSYAACVKTFSRLIVSYSYTPTPTVGEFSLKFPKVSYFR